MITPLGIVIGIVLVIIMIAVYAPTAQYTEVHKIPTPTPPPAPPAPPAPTPPKQEISCFIKGIIKSMTDTPQQWFIDEVQDTMLCHSPTLTWVHWHTYTARHSDGRIHTYFTISQNGTDLHNVNSEERDALNEVYEPLFRKLHTIKQQEREEKKRLELLHRERMRNEFEVIGCPPTK